MTIIAVETTEPSDSSAPPGPLDQAITADQTVGSTAPADFVRQARAELPAIAGPDRATAHRYLDDFALRRLPPRSPRPVRTPSRRLSPTSRPRTPTPP